jgi:type I restriction enzyme S subunit
VTTAPLKTVAEVRFSSVDKKTVEGQVPVRLCNYTDVYYNDRIVAGMPFMEATATSDQIAQFSLRRGDVLLTKDSETADDIGASAVVAEDLPGVLCGYHLAIARPRPNIDGRFLRWALTATSSRGQLEVAATGVTRFGLRQDAVAGMLVPAPPLNTQRAIADYLDAETARIDMMLSRHRRLSDLLEERRISAIAAELEPGPNEVAVRLKFRAGRPTSGNRDHSFTEDDSGVPCLRGLNIKPGRIDRRDLMRISEADHRSHIATELRSGDIVVVRSGNAGAAAVVPADLDGANCVDLVVLRRTEGIWPRYLEYALNSHQARSQATEGIFGATLTHFNAVDIAELRLRLPPLEEQRAVAAKLDAVAATIDQLLASIERQIGLLLERRQALITATVTGQLEIPGAAA